MKRLGFSISTLLLAGILLGAVAFVGSMVNPVKRAAAQEAGHDDHDHEAETKQTASSDPKALPKAGTAPMARADSPERKAHAEEERKQREAMMEERNAIKTLSAGIKNKLGEKTEVKTPLTDPTAIEPTSAHFFKDDMGEEGMKKQEAVISEKKRAFDKAMAAQRANPLGKTVPLVPGEEKSGQPGQVP